MDIQAFEEVQTTMSEEERNKGEEPKRLTKPKKEKQQKRGGKQKTNEEDKEVFDVLTTLGNPIVSPLKITTAK
jgi:hypothetical protein